MDNETKADLLNDLIKKHDEERVFFKSQKLAKMIDIFLFAFIIVLICVLSFTP